MTTPPRPPGDQTITTPDPDWPQLAACRHADPNCSSRSPRRVPPLIRSRRPRRSAPAAPSGGSAWPSRWTPCRTTAYGEAW